MNKLLVLGFLTFSQLAPGQFNVIPENIDKLTTEFMSKEMIPGVALAILHQGEVLYRASYGISNIELKTAVTDSTVFELASVSKQMTTTMIVELARRKKLDLDTKVGKVINDIPDGWKDITLRQLLGHMGGLQHKFEPKFHDSYLLDYDKDLMLAAAKKVPMIAKPGTDWEYSDQGYFLAGYIIEKIMDRDFDDLMAEEIFGPFGMKDTRFLDQDDIIPNRADGYVIEDGFFKNNRRQWEFELTPHFGVMSTINDMILYEQGLISNIDPSVIKAITSPYREFYQDGDHRHSYGLGWMVHDFEDRRIVIHSGYTGTVYLRDLSTGLSIILLTNRDENQGKSQQELVKAIGKEIDPSFPEF